MLHKFVITSLIILSFTLSGLSQELELLTPQVMDMGIVTQDSVVHSVIQFRNSGELPLKIKRVQTSCGCTAAELNQLDYQPGESGEIEIQFNTKGFSGVVRKYITIYLEDGSPSSSRVVLQANIKTNIEIKPAYLDLQNIDMKSEENGRSFLVTNNFNEPLVIKEILTNIENLEISYKQITLNPGASEEITITYKPMRVGRSDGYIDLKIENPVETVKRIPVFIYVKKSDQG
ncbi:MAG: DUF1573 domain-containing protein [Calditrichia bacterium]|nr:DUF1573 domain-containing protein [Calditrichia bacterium]